MLKSQTGKKVTAVGKYLKAHFWPLMFIWILIVLLLQAITARFKHRPLFEWYKSNEPVQKKFSCLSPWKIALTIEFPSAVSSLLSKPFVNRNTPYFLNSLANRFGTVAQMPPDSSPMTINDWCIGIATRLYKHAGGITRIGTGSPIFSAPAGQTENVGGSTINVWSLSNLALSMDGGQTMLSGYEVYHKYGSPLAWQYAQWKGWLASRLRAPAFPSWRADAGNPDSVFHYSQTYDPLTFPAEADFEWGSPFIQTGYLAPYGCDLWPCTTTTDGKSVKNACGNVDAHGTGNMPSLECQNIAKKYHLLLPWIIPFDSTTSSNLFTTQNAGNNPFMAFNIRASSPIILRFLGYGFDSIKTEKEALGKGRGTFVFTGGPAEDQYTQVDQFLTLTNGGGFFAYAERDGSLDISSLENYLFGVYTFEEAGKPAPKSQCQGGGGKAIGGTISGGVGGAGAGAMIGSAAGPGIGTVVGAVIGAGIGAFSGYEGSKKQCGAGHGACVLL